MDPIIGFSEFAQAIGCDVRALRHAHSAGLLAIYSDLRGGARVFDPVDAVILRACAIGVENVA